MISWPAVLDQAEAGLRTLVCSSLGATLYSLTQAGAVVVHFLSGEVSRAVLSLRG